jgi:hypothetical protein
MAILAASTSDMDTEVEEEILYAKKKKHFFFIIIFLFIFPSCRTTAKGGKPHLQI